MKKAIFSSLKIIGSYSSLEYHKEYYLRDENDNILSTIEDDDFMYDCLKKRFELCLQSFPHHDYYDGILRAVFKPEDVPIIMNVKTTPTRFDKLAERLDLSYEELNERLFDICDRGLLVEVGFGTDHMRYIVVPEYVIGWYEISIRYFSEDESRIEEFEKDRDSIDWKTLMTYYEKFWHMIAPQQDPRFQLNTIMRATPYSLPELEEEHHVLTYETAVGLIKNCEDLAIVDCACKYHEMSKSGETLPDSAPLKCCVITNLLYETYEKLGVMEPATHEEVLELLEFCHDNDHMTHVDNSMNPNVICMCHKDYCGITQTYYKTGIYLSNPSKFFPVFDPEKCIGCGICVRRCPPNALELVTVSEDEGDSENKKKKKKIVAMIEEKEDFCIGCLSCQYGCKFDAIGYKWRDEKDIYPVPEDFFEWTVRMAVDANKLSTLVFDEPLSKCHDLLRKIGRTVETTSFVEEKIWGNKKIKDSIIKIISHIARLKIMYGF